MDFTAIDFETANPNRASVCSVGVVRVRGGRVVASESWLMHPPAGVEEFAARNVEVHGITADQVKDAPGWDVVAGWVTEFVGRDTLIAHNAPFEKSVIEQASAAAGLVVPRLGVLCTVRLAKAGWPDMGSHRLPDVCARFGVELGHHHDALADAVAVAEFTPRMMVLTGSPTVAALSVRLGVSIMRTGGG